MSDRAKWQQYGQLREELRNEPYQALLRKLQERGFPRHFSNWDEVIETMKSEALQGAEGDAVLRPILGSLRGKDAPHGRNVLMVLFWPALVSISRQKRHWETDDDERWQCVTLTFLELLSRIDVRPRPRRYAQKIYNDTLYHLHEHFTRVWKQERREVGLDANGDEGLLAGESPDYAMVDQRDIQEVETRRLRSYMERGRINERDFRLLVETRVHPKTVAEYARETGQDYQTAKKRRQRAEAALSENPWRAE